MAKMIVISEKEFNQIFKRFNEIFENDIDFMGNTEKWDDFRKTKSYNLLTRFRGETKLLKRNLEEG